MTVVSKPNSDRVVVVTGAGGGLGRAYALGLAAEGYCVVVNDLGCERTGDGSDQSLADRVAEEIVSRGGQAVANYDDVSDRSAGQSIVECALDTFGRLDGVINNAGIVRGGGFADLSAEDFDKVVDVSLNGTVALSRAAWAHLAQFGAGRIVNIISHSIFGYADSSAYIAAKTGVFGLTRALATEGAAEGIKVNAIMPSALTRLTAGITDADLLAFVEREMPPERVAPLAVLLCSPDIEFTGQAFHAGAGFFAPIVLGMGPGVVDKNPTAQSLAASIPALLEATPTVPLGHTDAAMGYIFGRISEG